MRTLHIIIIIIYVISYRLHVKHNDLNLLYIQNQTIFARLSSFVHMFRVTYRRIQVLNHYQGLFDMELLIFNIFVYFYQLL